MSKEGKLRLGLVGMTAVNFGLFVHSIAGGVFCFFLLLFVLSVKEDR